MAGDLAWNAFHNLKNNLQILKHKLAQILSQLFITYYRIRYYGRVQFGRNIIVNWRFKLRGPGKLIIEDDCNLWAHAEPNQFHFYNPQAQIKIGSGTRLNGVSCHCQTQIKVGQNCLIGSATIMDTDFHSFADPEHILYGNPQTKPVEIGDGVWLAGQCAILKGVQIGSGSVVGFRSVVAKNFPGNVVVAGNPGRVVKSKE